MISPARRAAWWPHCPHRTKAPTIFKVAIIGDLERAIFGPILHIATFKSTRLDKVINGINTTGYGLTFGLHTYINDRVQYV